MFDSHYMRKRKYLAWRAPIICSAIKRVFHPTSVIDFGCSIGDLVQGFNEISVPAIGFDSCKDLFDHSYSEAMVINWDITKPLPTRSKFDLALCIEVLKFISIQDLDFLILNFKQHSKRVLIGYGGNEPYKKGIFEVMLSKGYEPAEYLLDRLREQLESWKSKPAIKALYHGCMYFEQITK